ncbi:phospholipase D-like domain-containing protein [Salinimicrobium sp. TH3]|uniref:phospholipase D-like domain-containing protein n=1 Tax=Salinimicrobium sp. TH3 TaxID=2997342 RepID=UPI002275C948|nr:phospholipase D-like domain-containing protein [Salinimicrobium sp. TH3]MCY2687577.1 phospholipase D-like domain-containing protein [Salinimicrobium sp. TH3]
MFLNKEKYKVELSRLISEAENEIVLVVPYIRMSKEVFSLIENANSRGIEILIICRKDGVRAEEIERLKQLECISFMSHPNLHSKIYLNEENIIVGSMNLYDYSQFFNREAGYLIEWWDEEARRDCLVEINEIKSGAELLFASKKVSENKLDFEVIKTDLDLAYEYADHLNKVFKTKTFRVKENSEGADPTCTDFYDGIDVVFSNRIDILPKYPDSILNKLFEKYRNMPEKKFHPFRTYCSDYRRNFTIYAPKGSYIDEEMFDSPKFAENVEKITMALCSEIDEFYKREFVKQERI